MKEILIQIIGEYAPNGAWTDVPWMFAATLLIVALFGLIVGFINFLKGIGR